jgi:hypothetical protein
MDEVTKSWRKLENKELHNLDFPPSVIRLIRARSPRRERNVGSVRERRHMYMKTSCRIS